jgi:Uma2 family endonuclease
MRALILEPRVVDELIAQRRRSGIGRFDEVWEGVLHIVPVLRGEHADVAQQLAEILGPTARSAGLFATMSEFNVGVSEHDYRVPDGGIHRARLAGVWHDTAALVIEIVSPGDESWDKLPFYAAHGVDEVLIVDPQSKSVDWLALAERSYQPVKRSALIELGPAELAARIDWP